MLTILGFFVRVNPTRQMSPNDLFNKSKAEPSINRWPVVV